MLSSERVWGSSELVSRLIKSEKTRRRRVVVVHAWAGVDGRGDRQCSSRWQRRGGEERKEGEERRNAGTGAVGGDRPRQVKEARRSAGCTTLMVRIGLIVADLLEPPGGVEHLAYSDRQPAAWCVNVVAVVKLSHALADQTVGGLQARATTMGQTPPVGSQTLSTRR